MKNKNGVVGKDVVLGENVVLEDNVKLFGKTIVGDGVLIKSGSVLTDVVLGAGTIIDNSIVSNSVIGENCKIGPFTHVRPNCRISDNVKIGSFVEIKNSVVGRGTKIPHLSYVGDAEIGENVNIGCGVVFANYNGKIKQKSFVGNNVFVGCNVNIIAPVKIADDTYICAGTNVTEDTHQGDFVIGRVRQENKRR